MKHSIPPGTPQRAVLVALVLGSLGSALPGAPALGLGPSEEREELDQWVPSIGIFGGFVAQNISGTVTSSDVMGPGLAPITQPIGASVSGRDLLLSADVGGSLELSTPRFTERLGSPRIFARGDLGALFGFERTPAGEGAPGPMSLLPQLPVITDASELTVSGQGSRTQAEAQPFLFSAGLGVAFTLDLGERRLRIKPSVEYMREKIEITGQVNRAVKINQPASQTSDFRLIELSSSASEVYHGVGPGLELELDAARLGPLMSTVFVAGQGYRYFGQLKVDLSDVNNFGESANWSFEKQRWGWGGRAGVRFRWQPR